MKRLVKYIVLCVFLQISFINCNAQNDTTKIKNPQLLEQSEQNLKEISDLQNELQTTKYELKTQKLYKTIILSSTLFIIIFSILILYLFYLKSKKIQEQLNIQNHELTLRDLQKEQLSLILNKVENAIIIADPDCKILWLNDGFNSLYGYSLEDLANSNKESIRDIVDNEKEKNQIEICISQKQEVQYNGEYQDMFGSKIWFQRNLFPILDKEKNIVSIVAIDNDLTMVKIAMNEINTQKKNVEEQKKKITDSITYASYIQQALLPADKYLSELFFEHFILFKPRDIVSGDFYWATKRGNQIIAVAADCTGHGVPGAFMSVLGISLLNEIVNKTDINSELSSDEILNHLRDGVVSALNQAGSRKTKDGMDLSLCIIDTEKGELQFSGANNSGLLLRKNNENNIELLKLEADRMPIGVYFKDKQFTKETHKIYKGDIIYLLSDGYIDQFGSDKNAKFMIRRFRELVINNFDKSLPEQKEVLNTVITDWMKTGKDEQIDDILVIGIKI